MTDETKRLREATTVAEHLCATLARAGHAMAALLDGEGEPVRLNRNDPDGPTEAEMAGFWWADTLDRSARRALELHRVGDGPAVADFARACGRYATALRVAAGGLWPPGLGEIHEAMRGALQAVEADTRLTAKGALRAHELDVADLRANGPAGVTLSGRVEHEARHTLAELRRLAGVAAPMTERPHLRP